MKVFKIRLIAALLALVGCTQMPSSSAIYDFGPLALDRNGGPPSWQLAVEVTAAPWMNGPGIDYRLSYADPLERRQYIDSRWAAPPAQLLAAKLRRKAGFVAIDLAADCILRVELQEFSHVFTTPQTSYGFARGEMTLIDGKRRPIESRAFEMSRPAKQPDVTGGVRSLVEVGEELERQLDVWLEELRRQDLLKNCRPGLP